MNAFLNRRQFLYMGTCALCATLTMDSPAIGAFARSTDQGEQDIQGSIFENDAPQELWKWSREAMFYQKSRNDTVICTTCPNTCVLSPGDRSVCRSKVNKGGRLYTLCYGNPCAVHMDPVEKKPLFHFKPGSRVFSLATTGCNFRCLNCQNWQISQSKPSNVRHRELFPREVIREAREKGANSIAYTYSEPITFYEYMFDTAKRAKDVGMDNLLVSNGFINKKPLLELCPYLDGANINLKAFSEKIYRKLNGGNLKPVLRTFRTLFDQGVHFEMTNLVIPGYTDDEDMLKKMCNWIVETIGQNHPLHLLRFIPRYKLNKIHPTALSTLKKFRKTAMQEGIRYVYIGNTTYSPGLNTYCHACGELILEREGYILGENNLEGNNCKYCGARIPGVW